MWLWFAVSAQAIIGSSAVFDKILLRKRLIEPWGYTFWLGLLGVFAALLLPFGYAAAAPEMIGLALLGGLVFLASAYFAFRVLEKIEASETLPLLGALSPLATLAISASVLGGGITLADYAGFTLLIAGSLALFLAERRDFRGEILPDLMTAAALLAASHVVSKVVFTDMGFISGFFWVKMGGVLGALALLAAPGIRVRILRASIQSRPRSRSLYIANRAYASVGSLLVSYAISLSQPALVDATQNVRYLTIFLLAWFFLGERFRGRDLAAKIVSAALIVAGLVALGAGEHLRTHAPDPARPIAWGATFSEKFARDLGLDWREAYIRIVGELRPARLRLVAYWDDIEPVSGTYNFHNLDWQLDEAERAGIPVILAIGQKVPRWPECHIPGWAAALSLEEREAALGRYLDAVLARYTARSGIFAWQVENEPFLAFGECPARDHEAFHDELARVRALDGSRPIVVTDSGELSLWRHAEEHADIFGTTMYRKIYPKYLGPWLGVIEYPLPPDFFRLKELIVRSLSDDPQKRFIVVELQGEPWQPRSLVSYTSDELAAAFSPDYFIETIRYAERAGFEEYYLWGAEWWYWMRERHGRDDYWRIAGDLFTGNGELYRN